MRQLTLYLTIISLLAAVSTHIAERCFFLFAAFETGWTFYGPHDQPWDNGGAFHLLVIFGGLCWGMFGVSLSAHLVILNRNGDG